MENNRRTVIIGLDGVPYELLKDFSEKGVMPNTKRLISMGTLKKMRSSIPAVSSVAWSSIITGVNPGEHGIFGFTDFPLHTYRLSFPNFSQLKMPTFWENDNSKRYVIVNVPSTYPARDLNGILISGFVALDLEKAVYPDSIIPDLRAMNYRIDVDSEKAHKSLELFINDLNRTNEIRISAYRYFWPSDWDTFMLVFTGTDRLLHFLWDAYEDEKHDFSQSLRDYFRRIDEIIGEVMFRMGERDNLIMLSDHGFEKLDYDVYINYILEKAGLLKLKKRETPSFSNIGYGTTAFALDPARIYINYKDKYPEGSVDAEDKDRVVRELLKVFKGLKVNRKKVIKRVYTKEEIYKGPYAHMAPDLVLMENKGFNLKASLNAEYGCSKGIFTGKHTYGDAFLLVNRKCKGSIMPRKLHLWDVVKVMERLNAK